MRTLKLMITSVGSLVGQNLLDVLDFHEFRRRERVAVIGTNSLAASPNNFRCDKCYLVPNTSEPEFTDEFIKVVSRESPDLILSGRDEDTEAVASIMRSTPHLKGKLPYGEVQTLKIALDKWESWRFTERHSLPFASVFVMGRSGDLSDLKAFVDRHGYPLIAKPIRGFASRGVYFVRNWEDAEQLSAVNGYMFQEYLGDPETLQGYFQMIDGPTPLFAHAPNVFHHSCHTVINPDGTMDPIFISRNDHESGVTVGFRKVENATLDQVARAYAEALYLEGGHGPLTVQFREDKNGHWKAQEMNLRTNGNTFPRFLMGQDDVGLIINSVFPEFLFPIYRPPSFTKSCIIGKSLHSHMMSVDAIAALQESRKVVLKNSHKESTVWQ